MPGPTRPIPEAAGYRSLADAAANTPPTQGLLRRATAWVRSALRRSGEPRRDGSAQNMDSPKQDLLHRAVERVRSAFRRSQPGEGTPLTHLATYQHYDAMSAGSSATAADTPATEGDVKTPAEHTASQPEATEVHRDPAARPASDDLAHQASLAGARLEKARHYARTVGKPTDEHEVMTMQLLWVETLRQYVETYGNYKHALERLRNEAMARHDARASFEDGEMDNWTRVLHGDLSARKNAATEIEPRLLVLEGHMQADWIEMTATANALGRAGMKPPSAPGRVHWMEIFKTVFPDPNDAVSRVGEVSS
ncbi:MAG TPA: hypothetical protein VHA82_17870 [Ramlibacter sp.]|uniref:hypothetical protein n=1 Tax=Ramlibacter sp. TaxID=1917967 RepID=UPI002BF38E6A|nr:hypothetical protein [Ramlibacter sp.]HVZ45680.1 hypothetical protein [Ramlibacter sp.]